MNDNLIKDLAAKQMGCKTWNQAIGLFNDQNINAMADLALSLQRKEIESVTKELHHALNLLVKECNTEYLHQVVSAKTFAIRIANNALASYAPTVLRTPVSANVCCQPSENITSQITNQLNKK